jgi:GNAT superfamily N-acetyltransferase
MDKELLTNLDKLHSTELGVKRIVKNLDLHDLDIIGWCKQKIEKADSIIRKGKNWYVYVGNTVLTINAHSFTIITAHRNKTENLTVKRIEKDELTKLLELYTHLNDNPYPAIDERIENIWARLLNEKNHYILGGYVGEKLVSTCVITVIENLTHRQTPYALIENVVTHPEHRNRGYGSLVLNEARNIAVKNNCYKIILVTGSKRESTLNFYEQAGYNQNDKTAFIQWLKPFTLYYV